MLTLAILSASLSMPEAPRAHVAAVAPATATVRIVRAAELRAGTVASREEGLQRISQVRERDGSVRRATLVEFY